MGTALVIMAAGLGSRYGGIKQLEQVGPSGEIIMEYSIYDALEAGFDKVVFIIRKDIEEDFKKIVGERVAKKVAVEYVFQDVNDLPDGYTKPEGRMKPWGTGHAVLSCLGTVNEPFVVLNADDYYGKEAFHVIYKFLNQEKSKTKKFHICMPGFLLGNTLSDNGTVTRGICIVNEQKRLTDIVETSGIAKGDHMAIIKDGTKEKELAFDRLVSMNMWGFTPDFLVQLEEMFQTFLDHLGDQSITAEFLLPTIIGELVKENKAEVTVLDTNDKWFGVTYKEDKEMVVTSFKRLVEEGKYPVKLF